MTNTQEIAPAVPNLPSLLRQAGEVLAQMTPAPSPCSSVCRMDTARGWCAGCLRTRDEIAAWSKIDDDSKRMVWARIAQRAQSCVSESTTLPSSETL